MSLSNHPSINDSECVTLEVDEYMQTLQEREEQQALKQRKKERKKLKKKLLEEQEGKLVSLTPISTLFYPSSVDVCVRLLLPLSSHLAAAGSVVEFIGPSGEVFEMRAW